MPNTQAHHVPFAPQDAKALLELISEKAVPDMGTPDTPWLLLEDIRKRLPEDVIRHLTRYTACFTEENGMARFSVAGLKIDAYAFPDHTITSPKQQEAHSMQKKQFSPEIARALKARAFAIGYPESGERYVKISCPRFEEITGLNVEKGEGAAYDAWLRTESIPNHNDGEMFVYLSLDAIDRSIAAPQAAVKAEPQPQAAERARPSTRVTEPAPQGTKSRTTSKKALAQAILDGGLRHPTNGHCYVTPETALGYIQSFSPKVTMEQLAENPEYYGVKTMKNPATNETLYGFPLQELTIAAGIAEGNIDASDSGTRIVKGGKGGRVTGDGYDPQPRRGYGIS